MAGIAEAVHLVLVEAVLGSDHFGADKLAELDTGIALFHARALIDAKTVLEGQDGRHAHGHAAHAFDASGDDNVHRAGHHGLSGKVQGLLRRTALTVNRGGGHALWQARGQHGVARNVGGLFTGLTNAAHDHILDQGGISTGARDQRVQNTSGQIGWMPARQTSALAAPGRTRGRYDIGLRHGHFLMSVNRPDRSFAASPFSKPQNARFIIAL